MKTQFIHKRHTQSVSANQIGNYLSRMSWYFRLMFPLPLRLLNSVAIYTALSIVLSRVAGWPVILIGGHVVLGSANLFLLAVILRLMDELKDLETDRQLFSHRPVPSGKVHTSDIVVTLGLTSLIFIAINLLAAATFWLAFGCLAYTYLMFVYFFAPGLHRRYLLINLATHNPSTALILLMAAGITSASQGKDLANLPVPQLAAIVVMYWFPVLGWELARKIRSAEEENAYVTYSQIFGRVPAASITLAVQTVPLVLGLYIASQAKFTPLFVMMLVASYLIALYGHLRFIAKPSAKTSCLRPFAEIYALLIMLAPICDHLMTQIWR